MHLTRLVRTTGFRLAALYAGLFGVSVLILFGVIYWITTDTLRTQAVANVTGEVSALSADFETGGLAHIARTVDLRRASASPAPLFYLLLDANGRKLAGNLPELAPRTGWQRLPSPRAGSSHDEPADAGERVLLAFGSRLPDRSFLLVGQDIHHIAEIKEAIILAFGWAIGGTVLLGIVGGAVLSGGFLRRIDAINETMQAIVEGRLTDRIPTLGTNDELDRLARNLNDMLDSVQALMDSLRQVSNDIAHDLRTPLSRLRQRLEEVRLNAYDRADYEAAVDRAIADTDGILATFSALLRIAQIEAGTRKAAFANFDLSGLFDSIVQVYEAVADDRGQTLQASIEPHIAYRGDQELLTQMLANLVENALRHTPSGTRIRLDLENGPRGPVGTVSDTGPGIPEDTRDKVFRRFFRLETSRSTGGSGLGLSLVAAVAEIHGIAITLADNRPGLRAVLDFAPETRP